MKTADLLRKHDFKFKKRFGQNFITDINLLNKIVDSAEIDAKDIVIEIGPGAGTLTKVLSEKALAVIALEIDHSLIPILEEQLSQCPNVKILNEDALKVDFDQLVISYFPDAEKYKIVANLPYYITTPLLFNALENSSMLKSMVVMVQKEVGERLNALPGSKEYGVLTIMANFYAKVSYLFTVSKKIFSPEPEVDSAIVKFEKHDESPYRLKDKEFFNLIVRSAFSQRRKTFLNAIKNLGLDKESVIAVLNQSGYDEKIRGESLSLNFFVDFANTFAEK